MKEENKLGAVAHEYKRMGPNVRVKEQVKPVMVYNAGSLAAAEARRDQIVSLSNPYDFTDSLIE